MPTIIDSLLITLGIDASNFEAGQKQSASALVAFKQAAKEAAAEAIRAEKEKSDAVKQAAQEQKTAKQQETAAAKQAAKEQSDAAKQAIAAEKQKIAAAKQAAKDLENAARQEAAAAKRQATETEASNKSSVESVSRLRNELLGLYAVFTAGRGLKDFVRDTVTTDAATGRLAHSLDLSTETLSAWEGAARRVGGSSEATATSLQSLTNSYEELLTTGKSAIVPQLRFLGITNADQLKNLPTFLLSIADAFHKMDPRQAMFIGQSMGLDPGTIRLIELGRVGIEKLLAEQRRHGVITEQDAAAAEQLQKAWQDLTDTSNTLDRTLLTEFGPALISILKELTHFAEWFVKHPKIAEAAFVTITAATVALSAALSVGMVGALGSVALGFTSAGAAGTVFLGTLGLLLARISAVGVAIGSIYEGFHVGSLNTNENADLEEFRKKNNLPAGPQGARRVADASMSLSQSTFLSALSKPESGGSYTAVNSKSGAFGRYQFLPSTWDEVSKKLGLSDKSPVSQDKAAWYYASQKYSQVTGRDLAQDVAQGGHGEQIAAALRDLWPSLPGGSQQLETQGQFDKLLEYGANAQSGLATLPRPSAASIPQITNQSTQSSSTNTSSNNTSIGTIVVHTSATDADGVAKGLRGAITKYSYVPQANLGLA